MKAENEAWQKARVPLVEALKAELTALAAANTSWEVLVKHCYSEHPPKSEVRSTGLSAARTSPYSIHPHPITSSGSLPRVTRRQCVSANRTLSRKCVYPRARPGRAPRDAGE